MCAIGGVGIYWYLLWREIDGNPTTPTPGTACAVMPQPVQGLTFVRE